MSVIRKKLFGSQTTVYDKANHVQQHELVHNELLGHLFTFQFRNFKLYNTNDISLKNEVSMVRKICLKT